MILLLTDGEDHEGRALRVAQTCKQRGITVHCAGFGSALGPFIVGAVSDLTGSLVIAMWFPVGGMVLVLALGIFLPMWDMVKLVK